MKAYDFQYGEHSLSDFDMIICSFENKGLESISNGATVTFNAVPTLGGSKHELVSTQYDDCLETTIQICKSRCDADVTEISSTEFQDF